jgi:hypothetical protein
MTKHIDTLKIIINFLLLKEKPEGNRLGDLGTDGRIILK